MSQLTSQRAMFCIPEDVAYFNCAYNSPQLKTSTHALELGVQSKTRPWERGVDGFFKDADRIRSLASRLFGGNEKNYAVVPSVSYGIATAAQALAPRLGAGDTILLIAEEFPSNVYIWQRTASEKGAALHVVPAPPEGNWTKMILDCLNKSVKVLSVSSCHWTNGAKIDLEVLGRGCRENGTAFVIDATQSLGVIPFSMEAVQPDFLVAAGYKWLLCPYGFSLFYVAPEYHGSRPLEETWVARANAKDFAGLVNYCEDYFPGARKFDVGQTCAPTILPGAVAALEQIQAWGIKNISETLEKINSKIIVRLENLGFSLVPEAYRLAHMFGAQVPVAASSELVSNLSREKIYVSMRGSSIRFAPHLHITKKDINRLLDALETYL